MNVSPATKVAAGGAYVLLLLPIAVVLLLSVSDRSYFYFPPHGISFQWYQRAWNSQRFVYPAVLSVLLAVAATFCALAFALPASLAIRRLRGARWIRLVEFVYSTPLLVPQLILGIALLNYYNGFGLLDTWTGLLLAHTILVFPFLLRSLLVSVHALDPALEQASEILGATPFTTFRRIVFPALIPGLLTGMAFAFITSFDQFTLSLLITQRDQITLPVAIYKYLYDTNDPVAAAVSSVLVLASLIVALLLQRAGWIKNLSSL